jgi:hypothetical protein
MGTRFLIADRGRRRSSRSRGSLISAAIQRSSSRLLARTKFFEPIAGKMSEGVSGGHEEETTRKSSRPRAQAGSTHRLAYFRLGGEGARSGRRLWRGLRSFRNAPPRAAFRPRTKPLAR